MNEEEQQPIEIGAAWDQTSKNGRKYMSGKLGNARLLIFPNTNKRNPKEPDWRVCVAPQKKREERPEGWGGTAPQRWADDEQQARAAEGGHDDGIPF